MTAFFAPAIWVISRLSYPRKLLFTAVVFLAPMLVLAGLQLFDHQHAVHKTRAERAGLSLLLPVLELLVAIQDHHGSFQIAETADQEHHGKTVVRLLDSFPIDASNTRYNAFIGSTLTDFRTQWQTAIAELGVGAGERSESLHREYQRTHGWGARLMDQAFGGGESEYVNRNMNRSTEADRRADENQEQVSAAQSLAERMGIGTRNDPMTQAATELRQAAQALQSVAQGGALDRAVEGG